MRGKARMPETLEVLEQAGFTFALDFDGSLEWTAPVTVDRAALVAFVQHWSADLAEDVAHRAARDRSRCHGGPLNGQPCPLIWRYEYLALHDEKGTRIRDLPTFKSLHVKRGQWAVYRIERDRRAFFVGYATSEAKARRGEVQPSTVDPESTERRALGDFDG